MIESSHQALGCPPIKKAGSFVIYGLDGTGYPSLKCSSTSERLESRLVYRRDCAAIVFGVDVGWYALSDHDSGSRAPVCVVTDSAFVRDANTTTRRLAAPAGEDHGDTGFGSFIGSASRARREVRLASTARGSSPEISFRQVWSEIWARAAARSKPNGAMKARARSSVTKSIAWPTVSAIIFVHRPSWLEALLGLRDDLARVGKFRAAATLDADEVTVSGWIVY